MYFYSSRKIEKRWLGIVVSSCMDEVIMKLVLTDTNTACQIYHPQKRDFKIVQDSHIYILARN
jgi:hypothetical protein